MHIPPSSAAASAASILAQSTSKDSASGSPTSPGATSKSTDSQLEKTSEANPDRDAQGQADGLPHEELEPDENDTVHEESVSSEAAASDEPDLPTEHLDITG
ncbi:hypothetical protein [Aureliella helgolandensis]|uniref:Uncharacterized protein n=1 Tax=Aureliella helgolandensis TaxID=2527968 RepID=A0A518GEK1_9BACT|nr:hypothetical protein [Aureliella helgolandensis]QDV26990.1 hypothetical protein Q31a_53700 [Aureliella helgolandensis]